MNLFIIQNLHKDKNAVCFRDCSSILLQDYYKEYWLIIICNSCCLMDCITHKFLILCLVYFPIKRLISRSRNRSRHACPHCWDLGRKYPTRLLSHFEKPHSGDYQPIPLIFQADEDPGNKFSTSKKSIHPWTNFCYWSKWKIITYISDLSIRTGTGLVTSANAGEQDGLAAL